MQRLPTFFAAALLVGACFAPQQGVESDPLGAERALNQERYRRVEGELARADLSHLSEAQRTARAEMLVALDAYVARADFGQQPDEAAGRVPQFVDDGGRRCAVAELFHVSGRDDLVEAVRAENNEAWVIDLAEREPFLEWLDDHGLSLFEAARVQGPAMPSTPAPPSPAPPTPGTPSPRGPSTPGAVATPGAALTPGFDESGWWLWWEFNKVEFLRPNRLEVAPVRDDSNLGRTFASQVDFVRRSMLPPLLRALDHPDARVRAAAARAVGRVGGREAVDALAPHLDDTNGEVRDMVILALGASGAPRAQQILLELARDGRLPKARNVERHLRAIAVVALGLGRAVGFDESVDAEIEELYRKASGLKDEPIRIAAMSYALLAPSAELQALALQVAEDRGETPPVRCRAIEALRGRSDVETISTLQHLASRGRIELRRSAALALGELEHPLVPAALMTAHDLEKEPLARAFALISLGRRGGPEARDYLVATLEEGKGFERPWAALALGLLAHDTPDPLVTRKLRERMAKEKRADDRPAYWLALGLARDPESFDLLRSELVIATNPRSRMYAAQALAMLGGDAAHEALAKQIAEERSSLVRSQIALALGTFGRPGDVEAIVEVLRSVSAPELQGQTAAAIAFHGSSEALHRLGELVSEERVGLAARAASLDALGMILSRGNALSLSASARSSNFTLFDAWLNEAIATTL